MWLLSGDFKPKSTFSRLSFLKKVQRATFGTFVVEDLFLLRVHERGALIKFEY
jgi:hypothetical protein